MTCLFTNTTTATPPLLHYHLTNIVHNIHTTNTSAGTATLAPTTH